MNKINGLNLHEEFYNYFLVFCQHNGINENRLSLDEFKSLILEVKELYKHNKQK